MRERIEELELLRDELNAKIKANKIFIENNKDVALRRMRVLEKELDNEVIIKRLGEVLSEIAICKINE